MNDKIFMYAKKLVKRVEYEGSTNTRECYKIKFGDGSDLPVVIVRSAEGTYIKCTCKHCSVNESKSGVGNPYLCSYKLAVILKKGGLK